MLVFLEKSVAKSDIYNATEENTYLDPVDPVDPVKKPTFYFFWRNQ